MNYTLIMVVMAFLILISFQYTLNTIVILLKEIISLLNQMNTRVK
jgi:hypothetical protein